MTDSIPWFKAIQSVGRGFRPGMEVKVMTSADNVGKTLIIDYESDDFKPWRVSFLTHYAEYRDFATGETYWKKFKRQLMMADLYGANNVIRKNEDGTYEYIKNRETGELRKLTEEEIMWLLLKI
jgi:hypothetical protein